MTRYPKILAGISVFCGIRVPVEALCDFLEKNYMLDDFGEYFPTVMRESARLISERSEQAPFLPAA